MVTDCQVRHNLSELAAVRRIGRKCSGQQLSELLEGRRGFRRQPEVVSPNQAVRTRWNSNEPTLATSRPRIAIDESSRRSGAANGNKTVMWAGTAECSLRVQPFPPRSDRTLRLGYLDDQPATQHRRIVSIWSVASDVRCWLRALANWSPGPPQSAPNALSSILVASYVILELSDVSRC